MFRVKICGLTTAADAELVAAAGADAVGLNLYPKSPRFVPAAVARDIVRRLPPPIQRVGVFVNADVGEVLRAAEETPLDAVQLHGDEPPEMLAALRGRPVIKAFRLGSPTPDFIADYLTACRELDCLPSAILIDALRPGTYGGTGCTVDWDQAGRLVRQLGAVPFVLAGGLTPDNVAAAIRAVRPAAVDTASGVELSPGHKSPTLVRQFVRQARAAFGLRGAGLPGG